MSGCDWLNIRDDFSCLKKEVHQKPLIYFDSAATAQKPNAVLDAMNRYYREYCGNVNRGVHYISGIATKKYEEARNNIKKFLKAGDERELIFLRSTTEAINLVAHGLSRVHLEPGDEIILTEMEHHANIVPWYMLAKERDLRLKVVPVLDDGTLDIQHFKSLFNARTKLFSVVHASNALGTINPISELITIAKKNGVPTLVDGAQAVHHLTLDLKDLDADFYAFSGHKAYGPTGIGVLVAKKEWLEKMPPYQGGGDMISSVSFEHIEYMPAPQKFEAGTPNIAGAIGLEAAFSYLQNLGIDAIAKREQQLLCHLYEGLKNLNEITIMGDAKEKVSLISFVYDGVHPHDLSSIFDREGIAIRAGHLCTEPLVRRFGQSAFLRASLAFYNTHEEIDYFVRAFGRVKELFRL